MPTQQFKLDPEGYVLRRKQVNMILDPEGYVLRGKQVNMILDPEGYGEGSR